MACREYTIPREDSTSQPKGWIQGNTQIGLVLEVTTSCLHGKHGVEIRIWSLSRDNTHSWVRISHGSNEFVMDLENNDTEIPEDQLEEQALQLDAKDFVYRSKAKAKAKPQRRELVGSSPRIVPIERRNWIDIEPALFEYEVSKKVIYLLRHSLKVHREEDGAVHFWRRGKSPESIPSLFICLTVDGDFSTALIFQEQFFFFRALQRHSGRNPSGQCENSEWILPTYLPHWMCS